MPPEDSRRPSTQPSYADEACAHRASVGKIRWEPARRNKRKESEGAEWTREKIDEQTHDVPWNQRLHSSCPRSSTADRPPPRPREELTSKPTMCHEISSFNRVAPPRQRPPYAESSPSATRRARLRSTRFLGQGPLRSAARPAMPGNEPGMCNAINSLHGEGALPSPNLQM